MSRYDFFRRRIAPIAFLLAIALIARDSCQKHERSRAAVELDFGAARARVRAVDVSVVAAPDAPGGAGGAGDEVARFHRSAAPDAGIGPCRFAVVIPDGELRIDVDLGGEHRQLTRRFHAVGDATIQVAITEADLAPRAP